MGSGEKRVVGLFKQINWPFQLESCFTCLRKMTPSTLSFAGCFNLKKDLSSCPTLLHHCHLLDSINVLLSEETVGQKASEVCQQLQNLFSTSSCGNFWETSLEVAAEAVSSQASFSYGALMKYSYNVFIIKWDWKKGLNSCITKSDWKWNTRCFSGVRFCIS